MSQYTSSKVETIVYDEVTLSLEVSLCFWCFQCPSRVTDFPVVVNLFFCLSESFMSPPRLYLAAFSLELYDEQLVVVSDDFTKAVSQDFGKSLIRA